MEQTTSYDLLNKIDSPEDLRKLSVEALPEVCNQLRNKIIDELSRNPGHFGSSLGVIELTVALHYVYQTPYDRIVWDVGHQAYGHKILTGRRDRFCTNRKLNGICPFPSPAESEYDTFTCGQITEKPAETRMGSGKGSPEYWVAVVKPGRVMFEIAGVPEETAREAMRLAMHKLPIKCKFVSKETGGEQ